MKDETPGGVCPCLFNPEVAALSMSCSPLIGAINALLLKRAKLA